MADPADLWIAEDHPDQEMGIRRHHDRCFHVAEEETTEGYIVQGILIPRYEVAEVRTVQRTSPEADALRAACQRPV